MHQGVFLYFFPWIYTHYFTLLNTSATAQVWLHIQANHSLLLFIKYRNYWHQNKSGCRAPAENLVYHRIPGKSQAILDEEQTVSTSRAAGNQSPLNCEHACSAIWALCQHPRSSQVLVETKRAGCIFINHFLTPNQGYVVGSLLPVDCVCTDKAETLCWDLSSSLVIYGWKIKIISSWTLMIVLSV